MIWPDRPTCHGTPRLMGGRPVEWRPPEPPPGDDIGRGAPYRACNYCGSVAAEDLYPYLAGIGMTRREEMIIDSADPDEYQCKLGEFYQQQHDIFRVGMADWKYGWPHKFYVDGIPNPWAGYPMIISSRHHDGIVELGDPQPAPATERVKFYSEHLTDLEDPDTFEAMTDALFKHTGVRFTIREGRLHYSYTGV